MLKKLIELLRVISIVNIRINM